MEGFSSEQAEGAGGKEGLCQGEDSCVNLISSLPTANLKKNPTRSRESPYLYLSLILIASKKTHLGTWYWYPRLPKPFKFIKGNPRWTSRPSLNYSLLINPMGSILYYIMLVLITYHLELLTVAHMVTFYEQQQKRGGHTSCHQDI